MQGLHEYQVSALRRQHGSNALKPAVQHGFFSQFIAGFGDPIIKVLLAALGINLLLLMRRMDWFEPVGIAVAILVAVLVSTISEYGSEKAYLALQAQAAKVSCRVWRGGGVRTLPLNDLVVGDCVLLQAGEQIPADGVLIEGGLAVDQSALNGESREAVKRALQGFDILQNEVSQWASRGPQWNAQDRGQQGRGTQWNSQSRAPKGSPQAKASQGGQKPQALLRGSQSKMPKWDLQNANQLLRGSVVQGGEGVMQVCRVGEQTLYGRMAHEMQEKTRESPLKIRLSELARGLSRMGYLAGAVVLLADFGYALLTKNMLSPMDWPQLLAQLLHAITLAVTVVVVSVPEGLPMMITVVLSANMRKMLKSGVLVRKLVGIETAGSMNILFTDKTGTLTQGRLQLTDFADTAGRQYTADQLKQNKPLYEAVLRQCVYNTQSVWSEGQAIGGNATDRAMSAFAAAEPDARYPVLRRFPFDSEHKYAITEVKNLGVLVKGAPDVLLPLCTATPQEEHAVRQAWMRMTQDAMRVIVLATADGWGTPPGEASGLAGKPGELPPSQAGGLSPSKLSGLPPARPGELSLGRMNEAFPTNPNTLLSGGPGLGSLKLVALVGIRDAVRPEAGRAVEQLRQAGVQTVMVTGDHPETARAVARQINLLNRPDALVLDSAGLAGMSDAELARALPRLCVVARAVPSDKSRLVRVAQGMDAVVGMTGDGINDAAALKKADVGFAVGSGTAVARQAADIILMDDNLASVVRAVLYGRTLFKSIRKFIVFQLTMNISAVGISVLGPFLGIETPVTVMQMLWINMIMDTLAGLAFAGEPALPENLREPPKKRNVPVLNRYMVHQIACMGAFTVALCTAFLIWPPLQRLFAENPSQAQIMTGFFALFIFSGICNAFNARTIRVNLLAHLWRNPAFMAIMGVVGLVQVGLVYYGDALFRTSDIPFASLGITFLLAATVIPIDVARKVVMRAFGKRGSV